MKLFLLIFVLQAFSDKIKEEIINKKDVKINFECEIKKDCPYIRLSLGVFGYTIDSQLNQSKLRNILSRRVRYFIQNEISQIEFQRNDSIVIYEGNQENKYNILLLLNNNNLMSISIIMNEDIFITIEPLQDSNFLVGHLQRNYKSKLFNDSAIIGLTIQDSVDVPLYNMKIKRSLTQKTRCGLRLVADYKFFKRIGKFDIHITTNFMISLIARVNQIFLSTKWIDGNDYGFEISSIVVHTSYNSDENHYNKNSFTVLARDLLYSFTSYMGSPSFCVSHLFTATFLQNSVLGIAFRATSSSYYGGICSFSSQSYIYYNTALVSSIDQYNMMISPNHLTLIIAHGFLIPVFSELGHSFGCNHDPVPSDECSPQSHNGGAYIMSAVSHLGFDKNNWLFSPCSIRQMHNILNYRAHMCFTEPHVSFCGNGIVEDGEECDTNGVEDQCCHSNCRLKAGSLCSDYNSPCCSNCRFSTGNICRAVSRELANINCQNDSFCNGVSPDCPVSSFVPDSSDCGDDGKCFSGVCMSFCSLIHPQLEDCLCENMVDACKRCCRSIYNDTCRVSTYFAPFSGLAYYSGDHTCFNGICKNNVCVQSSRDSVSNFWSFIERLNQSGFVEFMKGNVIFTVIVLSILLWIPSCILIKRFEIDYFTNLNRRLDKIKRKSDFIVTFRSNVIS